MNGATQTESARGAKTNPLLEVAFSHHHEGRPIISVKADKKPYLKGWDEYLERQQTEAELRQQFSNSAYGLALILYPGCSFGVLDHDGPHAKKAWQTTGIELPETARNISRSGYDHLFFRMPANTPAQLGRKVRLVEASCDCKDSKSAPKPCGVDFLVNGYVVMPPTPGYREDPDHPLESAALMPQAVIDLAIQKQKEEKAKPTGDANGKVNHGKRKATACSLAGTMCKRGMSLEAIRAALKADSDARFNPPLEDEEIDDIMKSVAYWEPGEESSGKKQKLSQADILLDLVLASDASFFHTPINEPFIVFSVNEHGEIWPVRSRATRRWLTKIFYRHTGKAPSSEPMQNALGVLDAKAMYDGEEKEVHLRTAWHEGAIYYDLADQAWRVVRIDKAGWKVVNKSPVYFRRYDQTAAQVLPQRDGTLDKLWDFINVTDKRDCRLIKAWLVVGLIPDIPRPILIVHGDQGAAKTTACEIATKILDPGESSTLKAKDEAEFVQGLAHNYAATLENVSYIPNWLSDLLCRAVTGEGFSKRQLYTDDEDIIFKFRRLLMLNGIGVAISKPDLLDRSLLIGVERISDDTRKDEKELWRNFEDHRPKLLGAVFDSLAGAIREYDGLKTSRLPRMADFAKWAMAAAAGRGEKAEEFLEDYKVNVGRQNEEAISESIVAVVLLDWLDESGWIGQPHELHSKLKEHAADMKISDRKFPSTPAVLTRKLKEVRPSLLALGWKVQLKERDNKGRRQIAICR